MPEDFGLSVRPTTNRHFLQVTASGFGVAIPSISGVSDLTASWIVLHYGPDARDKLVDLITDP